MTSDPIINQVDEEFSLQLTKLIKNYVLNLVNHEVDVITDSDWFDQKIKDAVGETIPSQKWVKSNEVAAYLNISTPYFHQKAKVLEKKGILEQSIHYFRTGNSLSSPYRWNLTKTAKVFKENVNYTNQNNHD